LQNTPHVEAEPSGLRLRWLGGAEPTAKYDLMLTMTEREEGVFGTFVYNADLFDGTTVERMSGHLRTLLEAAVADPEQRVSELPLLTAEEYHQLTVTCNDTQRDYPREVCLHELFAAQVRRTPETVALSFVDQELSYAELDARANRLAHYLCARGVGAESRVGILLERSVELVVSLLAVLKAGGAYVPLDPDYPEERLQFMLADAEAQLVLSNSSLSLSIGATTTAVLNLDVEEEAIAAQSAAEPGRRCEDSNLAYVIYTSGSTGVPKGVLITHAAICNHMRWLAERFPLTATDRVLQKTPISFDASVWEFYAPLLAGARLVLAQPEGHRDPAYLVTTMAREKVTVAQMVPSLWRAVAAEPGLSLCRALRLVFSGGEVLPSSVAERLNAATGAAVYNLYGPTEVTIDASCGEWADGVGETVPIGRPVANTQAYVLDANGKVAPVGVAGELYLGGVQLARGYWQRPALTAERFVPDPFSERGGQRLYRTGDLVKYRADGKLEYLGREDGQVKVRGYRIELGEIEAVLCRHRQVREAVAVARDHRLVGYVVVEEGLNERELRQWLRERLPEYMVPAQWVRLAELPLTPNGKVDRKALPAPDESHYDSGREYIAPSTPVQEIVAGIWEQLLDLDHVSVTDNFLDLGGHSLLATQFVSRVRAFFGIELPVRELFEAPSIEGTAAKIEAALHDEQHVHAPPIERAPRT
jgi:amino acid adenylation domain-containing protein